VTPSPVDSPADSNIGGKKPPFYRPSVAAILQNADSKILIGERRDVVGGWQFPQGGIEPGEAPADALAREVFEELGLAPHEYTVGESRGPYRYLFPPGRTKQGFHGQEQQYFLLAWRGLSTRIDFATEVPEFRAFRWIDPAEFRLEWLPEMKHAVYRQVFADFFGLTLS
jgi:putative (di)nucleoside polyphosphate hydrolase